MIRGDRFTDMCHSLESLDNLNSFFQQAISQKHSIYLCNNVLYLLVSKVMVGGVATYHVKLMRSKQGNAVCVSKQVCEDSEALMRHFMFIKDAIF